jgi:ribulose kinase
MSDPSPSEPESYYIGIDVGTGSARAALVSSSGHLVASHTRDIRTWRDKHDHRIYEQSTTDIWGAICATVHAVLAELKQTTDGLGPEAVRGIGFDATCSLAVVDGEGVPVSVTREIGLGEQGVGMTQSGDRNIILWADHRAEEEAEDINATGAVPLEFVGGTMSVRIQRFYLSLEFPFDMLSSCTSPGALQFLGRWWISILSGANPHTS